MWKVEAVALVLTALLGFTLARPNVPNQLAGPDFDIRGTCYSLGLCQPGPSWSDTYQDCCCYHGFSWTSGDTCIPCPPLKVKGSCYSLPHCQGSAWFAPNYYYDCCGNGSGGQSWSFNGRCYKRLECGQFEPID